MQTLIKNSFSHCQLKFLAVGLIRRVLSDSYLRLTPNTIVACINKVFISDFIYSSYETPCDNSNKQGHITKIKL